jgi:ABC-2 type transport system ATP-binding protein
LIRELQLQGTVLISSHDLHEIEQLCTHLAVLDRGKLAAHGSTTELLGRQTHFVLELSRTLSPPEMDFLKAMPGVENVHHLQQTVYRISWEETGDPPHTRLAPCLNYLLQQGICPVGIKSGHALAEKFLEWTGGERT